MEKTHPKAPDEAEKKRIIAACESFIAEFMKPRFLAEIRPTRWTYVIDIRGAWAAGRLRFMQRYRSGVEHNQGNKFDSAFARIKYIGTNCFDIY
jgi:hypothetical protein